MSVHFSSHRQDWRTPESIYSNLNEEFEFDFDPCPINPKMDGLYIEWGQLNFCNPPYKEISKWIQKGYEEFLNGKTVVFLIPSRTDTRWWHDYIMNATEMRFIKGRIRFQGATANAPFPSCIVVFKNRFNLKVGRMNEWISVKDRLPKKSESSKREDSNRITTFITNPDRFPKQKFDRDLLTKNIRDAVLRTLSRI